MATACRLTPRIKRKDGNVIPSPLHGKLATVFGSVDAASQAWAMSRTKEFEDSHPDLRKDGNGEASMEYLLGQTEIGALVSDEQIAEGLTSLSRPTNLAQDPTAIHAVQSRAAKFNSLSDLRGRVIAEVHAEDNALQVRYSALDETSTERKDKLHQGVTLYERLAGVLRGAGIGIGVLTEAEEGAGVEGVTDFSASRRTAEGLREMIRLKEGERGLDALPEEAAHVAIGMAMGQDKNVDRALEVLRKNEDLVKEVLGDKYETYNERYKGSKEKLVHEAAGHLLRDALKSEFETEKYDKAKKYKTLWQRMADAIINFLKRFKEKDFGSMLSEVETSMKKTARKILDDSFFEDLQFSEDAQKLDELFALSDAKTDEIKDIANRMIRDTKGRSQEAIAYHKKGRSYYSKSEGRMKTTRSRFQYMKDLNMEMREKFDDGRYLDAIEIYLRNATSDMSYQLTNFDAKWSNAHTDIQRAYLLNNINNFCSIYHQVVQDIESSLSDIDMDELSEEEKSQITRILTTVRGSDVDANGNSHVGLTYYIDRCKTRIAKLKMPIFVKFASKFVPVEKLFVPKFAKAYGREGGQEIKLDEQMLLSPEVGSIDHWLLPAALSNNYPVQVFQRILNQIQLEVRDEALDYTKQLKELTLKLEEAGYYNQDFMFAKDKEGKLTGRYIEKDGAEYQNLTDAQKKYYNAVMAIKHELDLMLPWNLRDSHNAVKVRKDMMEQIKDRDNLTAKRIWDVVTESWKVKSDDPYMLQKDSMIIDYDGNEFRMVPVRFLSFKEGEDMGNMSTDIVESMSRYAQMCCNYSQMHRIQPMMELGRSIMEEGKSEKYIERRDENGDIEKINVSKTRKATTSHNKVSDNTLDRINDIMESHLYGFKSENLTAEYVNKKGERVSVSLTKIGQNLMRLTAMNQYMMSVNAAVQNDITAMLQFLGESIGKKYYDKNDLLWAHSMFAQNLVEMLGDVNQRVQTSKINLFNEKFNVRMEDDPANFNRKGVNRLMSSKNLYFMTSMGEYHANTLIALALAHRTKLKDANGKEVNLWDALELVDMATKKQREADRLRAELKTVEADALESKIKSHPEWKNSKNKFLLIKKGYTKLDGTEFSDDDVHDFTRKSMHMSHVLNGVYNHEDAAKWQRYIGGQMLGMYRKWIAPAWWRRMNKMQYSLDNKEWDEGYYRTAFRIVKLRIRQLTDKTLAAEMKGHKLTPMEMANLRRAGFEVCMQLAAMGLLLLLKLYNSDHKRRSFAYNTLYYYVVRTNSEIGTMTPIGMARETSKILQSPSAVLSTVKNMEELARALFDPLFSWGLTEESFVKSGKYKGMTKLERAALKSPFLPGSHQLLAFLYPEDAVKFYE